MCVCVLDTIICLMLPEYISTINLQLMVRLRCGSSYELDIQITGEKTDDNTFLIYALMFTFQIDI